MATQLLAIGVGAADSADQTLAAGTIVSLMGDSGVGRGFDNDAKVIVSVKDPNGVYVPAGDLFTSQPAMALIGGGVFRFSRPASSSRCGVMSA